MKLIAVVLTILVGYIGCLLFPNTELPCVFSIATMGYFILREIKETNSEKE